MSENDLAKVQKCRKRDQKSIKMSDFFWCRHVICGAAKQDPKFSAPTFKFGASLAPAGCRQGTRLLP